MATTKRYDSRFKSQLVLEAQNTIADAHRETIEAAKMKRTNFIKIAAALVFCALLLVGETVEDRVWSASINESSYPFRGVKWTHLTVKIPRPLNINILEITLTDPGISFFVTPGNPDPARTSCEEVIARRTTTFVAEFDMQVGINGDFTDPDCDFSGLEGEPTGVHGLGVSYRKQMPDDGLPEIPRDQYSPHNNRPALAFTRSNEAYIGWYGENEPFPSEVYNAIGGNKMLVEDGRPVDPSAWAPIGGALDLHPRMCAGLSADGSKLIIIAVDGRQEGFSEGATLPEMTQYLIEFGAYTGLNLDGGGSSTMVFGMPNSPEIVNYPSGEKERVRANHLGIYAAPATSTPVYPEEDILASDLWQNYPTPCDSETWIPFVLHKDAHVTIRIYSLDGRLVRALDLGDESAGIYISKDRAGYWDGKNETGEPVASGIYFYNIQAGDFAATRKMMLIRRLIIVPF